MISWSSWRVAELGGRGATDVAPDTTFRQDDGIGASWQRISLFVNLSGESRTDPSNRDRSRRSERFCLVMSYRSLPLAMIPTTSLTVQFFADILLSLEFPVCFTTCHSFCSHSGNNPIIIIRTGFDGGNFHF